MKNVGRKAADRGEIINKPPDYNAGDSWRVYVQAAILVDFLSECEIYPLSCS